jgi:large repetitive protein
VPNSRTSPTSRILVLLVAALLAAPLSFTGIPGAAVAPAAAADSVDALAMVPASADTGEKPQSKVWTYASKWWAVLPTSSGASSAGTWIWRLDGTTWTPVLRISDRTDTKADVKSMPDGVAHVLLHSAAPTLVSVQYDAGTSSYAPWASRTAPTSLSLAGSETASLDVDSTGRMWVATESGTTILAFYADSPYTSFAGPVTIATGVSDDDISAIVAMRGGQIGMLWSNQVTKRFGFRVHADADPATTWSPDEVPAAQSALNVGLGMADDHLHLAAAADGTLYAAVKTSYDTTGYPKIALLIRRPSGAWDDIYGLDESGTRAIVVLNEAAGTLRVLYTTTETSGDIVYRESPMGTIGFGPRTTLMTGGLNNVTSTKQEWSTDLVVLAGAASGNAVHGVRINGGPAENSAPVASPGSISTTIAVAASGTLVATDEDGNPLTYSIVTNGGKGTAVVTDASTGAFTYTPNATGYGADSFTFKANDGTVDSIVATVKVTIGVSTAGLVGWWKMDGDLADAAPAAHATTGVGSPTFSAVKDGPAMVLNGTSQYATTPDANDLDIATNRLTLAAWVKPGQLATQDLITKVINTTSADGYQLSLSSANKVFVRLNNVARVDSTTLHPTDGSAWIHVAATYDGSTIRLFYNGVQESTGSWAGPIAPNTNALGIGAQNDGQRKYRGAIDDVRIYDRALSATEIAALMNTRPLVNAGTDQTITLPASASLAGTASDDGLPAPSTLTTGWSNVSGPGTVTFSDVGSAATTASFSTAGTYVLRLTASDGLTTAADDVQVIAAGGPVNRPPTAANGALTTPSGAAATGTLVATDPDSDPLSYSIVANGSKGAAAITNATTGVFTYTPSAGVAGVDSFTFKANDGTLDSNVAAVTVTIGVGATGLVGHWAMEEGSGTTLFDAAPPANNATTTGSPAWAAGTYGQALLLNGTSQYASVPDSADLDITGAITMAAWIKPGKADTQDLIAKEINGVADGYQLSLAAPSSTGKVFVRFNNDPNNRVDSLTSYPTNGAWVHVAATYDGSTVRMYYNGVLEASRAWTGLIAPNSTPLGIGAQSNNARWFQGGIDDVRLYDRALTAGEIAALAGALTNHAPATVGDSYSTPAGTALTVAAPGVLANDTDADGDPLTAILDTPVSHGVLVLNADGSFGYTPAAGFSGSDSFSYRASDGTVTSPTTSVTITVTPINHPPICTSGGSSTAEDAALTGSVVCTDAENDPLTYAVDTGTLHGVLVLAADGGFTYTPAADYAGPDGFTFTASDGADASAPTTWAITVTPVNDAPTAAPQAVTVDEDVATDITLAGNDVDAEVLSYTVVNQPDHGTLIGDAPDLTYTPDSHYAGADSFTFKANDGMVDSNVATVSIDVRSSLRAWWSLDEGTGNALGDSSTYDNDATLSGTPGWVVGKVGPSALRFDGAQVATVPDDSSLNLTSAMTIVAWIRPEQTGTQDLVTKAVLGQTNGYQLTLSSPTSAAAQTRVFFRFNQASSADTYRINSSTVYPSDGATWIHVAATYDGTTMRLYINGVLEASLDAPAPAVNGLPLAIGGQSDGQRNYRGTIDDLRLYARALSPVEIQALAGDTTPPVVTVPADLAAEATGPEGAIVTFSASALDDVDGPLSPVCLPASGATFGLGETLVTCGATDQAGNTGSATFTVTVADTTAPAITVPADIAAPAEDPSGAHVTFSVTAADLVDGLLSPSCDAASGDLFPVGATTVHCTAADAAGNSATASFVVTVTSATDEPPASPTRLGASISTVSVVLDWDNNAEADLAGYLVYRSSSADGPWSKLTSAAISTSGYADGTAPVGTPIFYRVTAADLAGHESNPASTNATRTIAFRSSSFAQNGGATSLVVTRPANLGSDDIMIAVITVRGAPAITPPSGWTLIRTDASGTDLKQATYFKWVDGTVGASFAWSFSAKVPVSGGIVAYSGVDVSVDPLSQTVRPVDASSGHVTTSPTTSIQAPSIATSVAGDLLVGAYGSAINATFAPPTGMVEQGDIASTSGKAKVATEFTDEVFNGADSTGSRIATADRSAVVVGQLIALRPAGSGPAPDAEEPTPPTNLVGTATSPTQVDLTWTASTDNVRVDHYVVERATGAGAFTVIAPNVTLARYADTSVQPDTAYSYRVLAIDPTDNPSDPSNVADVTTPRPPEPTGILFRSATQAANKVATTLALARPTGAQSGDVLLASVDVRGAPTIVPPAGWTLVRTTVAGDVMTTATFWHLFGPNEPASYTWTFSTASAAAGVLAAYSGVDGSTPIVTSDGQPNPSGTAISTPTVAAPAGAMIVGFFGTATNATFTAPTGMTERGDVAVTSGTVKVAAEATDAIVTAATTGSRTATASKAAVSVGQLVVLRPAS